MHEDHSKEAVWRNKVFYQTVFYKMNIGKMLSPPKKDIYSYFCIYTSLLSLEHHSREAVC